MLKLLATTCLLFMLASINFALAITCDDLQELYSTSNCCSDSTDNLCSHIKIIDGAELSEVFNTVMWNQTDNTLITSSSGITDANIDNVIWKDDHDPPYNYMEDILRSNLQKNLAILSAMDPLEFKLILSLSLTNT